MSTTAVEPSSEGGHGIPYERLVAWAAGPVAIAAGSVAVWLDNHFGLLGKAGLGTDQTAKAINDALTFAVGAGVTYLSQSKWMSNLAAWWTHAQTTVTTVNERMTEMSTGEQEPQEETGQAAEEEQAAPFEDEPGYDEEGENVPPDQTLEDGEGEDVGPDTP